MNTNKKDYIYWASFRRQNLDYLQNKFKYLYKGIVLDIGGRDRGKFQKPKNQVKKWIFADINPKYNPDILLDVTNMNQVESNSIDIVNAIELFEHVNNIKKGLSECYRILKKNGSIIISIPFLLPIHADPHDFQRWTSTKWKIILNELGFHIDKLIIMGKFYTHLAEIIKTKIKSTKKKRYLRKLLMMITLPFLNRLIKLDYLPSIKQNQILSSYHTGYFIIARKN